jgi:hypothetical protein
MNRKKILIGFAVCIVLFLLYSLFSGGDDAPVAVQEERGQQRSWDGGSRHFYGARFSDIRPQQFGPNCCWFSLVQAEFTNLQYRQATVKLTLISPEQRPGSNSRHPWFSEANDFQAYLADSNRQIAPAAKPELIALNPDIQATVIYRNIPTRSLGPTCNGTGEAQDPFTFRLRNFPGGSIPITIEAPSPPPGFCLFNRAEENARQARIEERRREARRKAQQARRKAQQRRKARQNRNRGNNKKGNNKKGNNKKGNNKKGNNN